ncbi:MAG: hypothetical protein NTY90_04820 [Candidatus Micrarchaeota archaeon]|nr:hypothetical protein [Candidatus Micrarchaeota archaeon]
MFLFEEKHEIPETLKRIEEERREVKETQKLVRATLNEKWRFIPWRIIIVPTKKGEPLPAHEDWNSVTERMRRLGAENLLVCGKFLEKFDRRQRPTEAALNALMDEHPALATALKETSAPFLRDDKAVAALQRQAYEKSFNKFARRAAKKGVGEEMLKKMKNVLLEKTNFGVGRCVGEAYNKLLLSNRFKKVRVHERYCR